MLVETSLGRSKLLLKSFDLAVVVGCNGSEFVLARLRMFLRMFLILICGRVSVIEIPGHSLGLFSKRDSQIGRCSK